MTLPLLVAAIFGLGIVVQWVAWRVHVPAIILLLVCGLALGNLTDVMPASAYGEFFFALVSLSVGIILFEGGLSLSFREIAGARGVVIRLVIVALAFTWLATAALAHWVGGFSTSMAVLLGALLTVSGPTVVLPLLRHVQPVRRIGSLAKWEGIVNDPIGAVLAALVFEVVAHPVNQRYLVATTARELGVSVIVGVGLGAVGAWLVVQMLRRYLAPDYLQNGLILALVLALFSASNAIQHESGLITVTVMGLILANQRTVAVRHVVEFKENLRVLLISTLFIVLAARIKLDEANLAAFGWRTIAFAALLIALIRPAAVLLSTIGAPLSWQEKVFLAWIHPRGIVAAAVSSLFALRLSRELGADHPMVVEADQFVAATFTVILLTVTVYGLTLAPLARWLGLSGENPQGVLFAGASPVVREIAEAVKGEGFNVLLVDTNPQNNAAARLAGLSVVNASITSEFVQEEIDLGGIGRLLAMTSNDEVNALAAMTLAERFGRAEVYQLAAVDARREKREAGTNERRGRPLFQRPMNVWQLEQELSRGGKIKKTTLTADFTYDDFLARYGDRALVLFRVEGPNRLVVVTSDAPMAARPGHRLISLVSESAIAMDAVGEAKPAAVAARA